MKEVSCRVFEILIRAVADKGVPLERMVAGTDVTLATLRDKNQRIGWDDTCVIMANLRPLFTDAEFVELGHSHFRSPMLRFVFVIARLRFTPMGFFRWLNTPKEGVGNQLFTPIVPSMRELSDDRAEIDLVVKDGYEVCWEFFTITTGNFSEMPTLLGYPRAKVTTTRLPRGMRFHVTIPPRVRLLTRIRRAITWPFTVRAAARELQEAHQTLQERVLELEGARSQLARQAHQLTAANEIARVALGTLSSDESLRAVCHALCAHAGCRRAELALHHGVTVAIGATSAAPPLEFDLESGDQALGHLTVALDDDSDDGRELVTSLLPTVALVVQKVLDQEAIGRHQHELEGRVAARTQELTAARDDLAATVARLEEARSSRERLFHNISHEIRTPLSLVLLLVDGVLTHHQSELTARAIDQLNSITASTRKLVRLVDELLLLASGQERDLRVQPEAVDLARGLPELCAGWALAAREAGLSFVVDAATAGPALVDPVALERVLANLLSNAIKFTPRGGAISVVATRGPTVTRIAVTDNGPGIDPEFRPRLFERFEQGAAGKKARAGSGIGLSIARELVRAHGGDLEVSTPASGRGTEFAFTIANASDAATQIATPRLLPSDYGVAGEVEPATVEPPGLSRGTILVAEDDPGLAQAITALLAREYTVITTHNGGDALAAATRHLPDLVITDIEMPGIDGIDLARQVHAQSGESPIPVIIMSARARLDDRIEGLRAGAIDYLVKPFDPSELEARVRAQLAHRDTGRRLHRAEKLAAMGTLSAGLAHELRNPANAIVNAIQPLRELLPPAVLTDDSGVGELIDVIEQCAQQVTYVSKQLLGFRRSGDLELRRIPVADVVQRALTNAGTTLAEVRVETSYDYTGTIRCAAPLLTQVLVNLLENAAQAAGAGGWVGVRTAGDADRVQIELTDSGPGVPPELTERVFEPFFTTKPPGQGTGLGLATARDLIHRHGGTLDLRVRDRRTMFVIDLPQASEVRR